jgi:transposase
LSDGEWEIVRPLLPRAGVGRSRIDDRLIMNGILYVLVTGCRWMDLPAK